MAIDFGEIAQSYCRLRETFICDLPNFARQCCSHATLFTNAAYRLLLQVYVLKVVVCIVQTLLVTSEYSIFNLRLKRNAKS